MLVPGRCNKTVFDAMGMPAKKHKEFISAEFLGDLQFLCGAIKLGGYGVMDEGNVEIRFVIKEVGGPLYLAGAECNVFPFLPGRVLSFFCFAVQFGMAGPGAVKSTDP